MWSVGELARATGVTVRALHHYDEIGLLRPSTRTASGHRRYSDEDMQRLYRIVALRGLGLALAGAAEREWPELIAAVEAQRAAGTDPADPRVQELAERWRELVEQFTGGDPGIASSLRSYYDDNPNAHGMSPDLMAYVRRAWEAEARR